MTVLTQRVEWTTAGRSSKGVLSIPSHPFKTGVVLAHGAGANMDSHFLCLFNQAIAEAGYPCLKFNFPYMQAGKKLPDPKPVLMACYRRAIDQMPSDRVIIGGKSMGGRIASYLGEEERVAGMFFLGYPLHPPGKFEELRDEHLYSIRKPILFVSGTKDPFARMDLLEATIGRLGKSASTHRVEGGGHSFEVPKKSGLSQDEVMRSVIDSLLKWLNSVR